VASTPDLKTEVKGATKGGITLVVSGLEERGKRDTDNFTRREISRSFKLPTTVDTKKMVSYMTKKGVLVIEFPVKSTDRSSQLPQHDKQSNVKELMLKLEIPQGIDRNKVHLVVKGQDLILKCEDVTVAPDSLSSIHLYERIRLPENIDLTSLKCVKQQDHLVVSAPLLSQHVSRGMHVSPLQKEIQKEIPIVERSDRSSLGSDRTSLWSDRVSTGSGAIGGSSRLGELETLLEDLMTTSNKKKKNKNKNVSSSNIIL